MNTIMTVLGPKAPKELGFCQCHEHLAISKGVSFEKSPVLLIDDTNKSIAEAVQLLDSGGGTVVDAQPGGCNRDAEALLAISRETGLHIVASTGFHKLCFYPQDHWIHTMESSQLFQLFSHELTVAMYKNIDSVFSPETVPAKAGIVKMALDSESLTGRYPVLFAAGARAAIEADVPAMIHIEQGSDPLALFYFLKDQGLRPERMIFCHMDRAIPDLSLHLQLLEKGIFLEYDTIGRFKYHSDQREIEIFLEMLNHGFENQLLFSLDTTRARLKSYDPSAIGLNYLLTTFIPLMLNTGITGEQIRLISHDNFIRAFTG